jgi:hypothetical protein
LGLELSCLDRVIRIQKLEEFSPRDRHSTVSSRSQPSILLFDQDGFGYASLKLFETAVCASVIDENHFDA